MANNELAESVKVKDHSMPTDKADNLSPLISKADFDSITTISKSAIEQTNSKLPSLQIDGLESLDSRHDLLAKGKPRNAVERTIDFIGEKAGAALVEFSRKDLQETRKSQNDRIHENLMKCHEIIAGKSFNPVNDFLQGQGFNLKPGSGFETKMNQLEDSLNNFGWMKANKVYPIEAVAQTEAIHFNKRFSHVRVEPHTSSIGGVGVEHPGGYLKAIVDPKNKQHIDVILTTTPNGTIPVERSRILGR